MLEQKVGVVEDVIGRRVGYDSTTVNNNDAVDFLEVDALLTGEERLLRDTVRQFTDDRVPGVMRLTNNGAATRNDSFARDQLALGFGDTSFRLEVGEISLVKYSFGSSPFGWHIIKRLE